jgi:filamentous hemagglutinin
MIAGAMKLYDILTTIKGAIEAYDEGGPKALVKYGMEEASINLLMSSSMKIVGKMVSKARAAVKDTFKASSSGGSSSASSSAKAAKDVPMSEGKVKWTDESAHMSGKAKQYNDSATGARSNTASQKGQAPTLSYNKDSGKLGQVRFDGLDNGVLVDRKISIVTTDKAKNQALRQSAALMQNNMTARWEVPDTKKLERATKMLKDLNINNITVKIVK